MKRAVIAGVGSYLPSKILTNADLEKIVDTTNEWIITRTGISERHIAADDEACSDLASKACERALQDAGISAKEIDMIIVATITQDFMMPSTACLVQKNIGAKNAFCMDVEAACSGFLYALETASQYIATGRIKNALVVGSEKLSSFVDWSDRATCVLFGDGAGAVVLSATDADEGILSSYMGSDGGLADLLKIPAGGSRMPASEETVKNRLHTMQMNGKEVFKSAVRSMCDSAQKVLDKAGVKVEDVALVIPHQANKRIIDAIAERLGSQDNVFMNLDKVGNISGASIPVALNDALKAGRIKAGDYVVFVAFGGGFTWGACLLRWKGK